MFGIADAAFYARTDSKESLNRARPIRTMVAPAQTASRQSSLMPMESSLKRAACSEGSWLRNASRKAARPRSTRAPHQVTLRGHGHKAANGDVGERLGKLQRMNRLIRGETAFALLPPTR